MPADNPQVGETWEWNDPMQGRVVRAVIIAMGADGLRLMARTGKRTTMPTRSFLQMWNFYASEPEPRLCNHGGCENIAFFRNREDTWICQDHVPFNTSVALPNETTISEDIGRLECPECESTSVSRGDIVSNATNERSYAPHRCSTCEARWFLVPGRGADTDGMYFAEDLTLLAARFSSAEIRLGFVARQSLTRAIGMRSATHLGGYMLISNNQFGDNTALVIQRGRDIVRDRPINLREIDIEIGSSWRLRASGCLVTVLSHTTENVTIRMPGDVNPRRGYQTQQGTFVISREDFFRDYEYVRAPLPEVVRDIIQTSLEVGGNDVVSGSVWRRRRNDNMVVLCRVQNVTENGYVAYDVFHNPSNLQINSLGGGIAPLMEVDQFLDHWDIVRSDREASEAISNEPNEGTFWRHIETRQVVRIGTATVTQRMNRQVPYVSLEKDHATTALTTFQRLYREMPFPPTKVPWVKDGRIFEVLSMEGAGDYRNLKVLLSWPDGEKQLPFYELLEEYDPIAFEEDSVLNTNVQARSEWLRRGTSEKVVVLDIGTVRDLEFVRYTNAKGTIEMVSLGDFIQQFDLQEIKIPTAIDDEWGFMDRAVYKVREIYARSRAVILRRSDGKGDEDIEVSFGKLNERYHKIERKSVFEHLDSDDDGWDD